MTAGYGIKAVHALATPGRTAAECAAQTSLISIDVGGTPGSVLDARLVELTGRRFRKLGRFMQLALTGAVETAKKTGLELPPARTGVFLATGLGNISDLMPFSHAVFGDPGYHLSAIQFANSVGNAGAFYIAQALGLTGPVLALSQDEVGFEAALLQAVTLLDSGELEYALVGAVDVAMPNVKDHLARMGLPPDAALKLSEGSAWWLLGRTADGDFATLETLALQHEDGAAGVTAPREFNVGMHYAKSGLYPTLFLSEAREGETFETVARTREGMTGKTRVRRGGVKATLSPGGDPSTRSAFGGTRSGRADCAGVRGPSDGAVSASGGPTHPAVETPTASHASALVPSPCPSPREGRGDASSFAGDLR